MNRKSPKTQDPLEGIRILVVDDQEDVRRGLSRLLETQGCEVTNAASGEEALSLLNQSTFDLVFTDLKMDGMSGIDLLHEINKRWIDLEVVMITGYGTIELAVSCLQNGASHFITKPFDNKEILTFVTRASYKILSRKQNGKGRKSYISRSIVAVDTKMTSVLDLVDQVAPSRAPVLIEGASGTGKELIAHEIHTRSQVSDRPFLVINCIALPDTLLESELFGFRKGAFTGAHKDSKGLFEKVNGGTIFLDEIASMSPLFQGKVLRVLQEKVVRPLGSSKDIPVDFRLIAASNKNLEEMVDRGEFREDLFYRVRVVKIDIPPLKDRPLDIPALAEYFLKRAFDDYFPESDRCPELSPTAIESLQEHHWKGNVRELENTIQRALIVCPGEKILPAHLGLSGSELNDMVFDREVKSYEAGKQHAIEKFQRNFIKNTLQRTNGNISQAAEMCGLTRAAFQRIMRKLKIERN